VTSMTESAVHAETGMEPVEVPEGVLAKLKQVSVTTIAGVLGQLGVRNTYMRDVMPRNQHQNFAGAAFTLRTLPTRADVAQAMRGRLSLHRESFKRIGRNQVLVIDARGDLETGVLGDIYAAQILSNGGVALVTDGATRDLAAMQEVDLPIYTRGMNAGAFGERHIAFDLNVPIQCAGVLVMPGDVLVGDPSGVIVVPQALAAEVAEKGFETDMRDAFSRMKVLQGVSVDEVFPLKPSYQPEYEAWRRQQLA
jgi:5-oxopent-3-ene-1,2,5-tricarboxylate decarboxylase/2-hydroxyhepta-2,4-diene-1,7-dioate isomerase